LPEENVAMKKRYPQIEQIDAELANHSQKMSQLPEIKSSPFSVLIASSSELKKLRTRYASASAADRELAAEFVYSSAYAAELFRPFSPDLAGGNEFSGPIEALAIDPDFAPALLSVGSLEHQLGRHEEAMGHFLRLTTLPSNTTDLAEIIEKAGQFLIDSDDMERAESLYRAAVRAFPTVALFFGGLGYCASKLGRKPEALVHARMAVELEPENAVFLCDLGWALIENNLLAEAEVCLKKAISLAPGETMAEANLQHLGTLPADRT
jgi:tetratricopeptide (TPR) repeat protein